MKRLKEFGISLLALLALAGIASAQKWQALKTPPTFPVGAIGLLTDGTVLLHEEQDSTPQKWYKLTPDADGDYIKGKITPIASTAAGYGPFYFGSVVLPDGRFIIEGGEYNLGSAVWTNMGAIYDPVKNKWTPVNPPPGMTQIGDAQAIILSDGTYMQASCCVGVDQAYFNPKTLGWTNITNTGKSDRFDEEGWNLLPNGDVLTTDAIQAPNSEVYNPKTKKWTSAGSTIVRLEDPGTQEIGPAVLMPNGTVFATGANSSGAGHTAIYNTKTKKWAKGPDFQGSDNCSDAPAALEINGNVLIMASPGFGQTPSTFYEWNGSKLAKIAGPPNASQDSSFYGHFLELPSGQLLFSDFSTHLEVSPRKEPSIKPGHQKSLPHRPWSLAVKAMWSRAHSSAAFPEELRTAMISRMPPTVRWCVSPTLQASTFSTPRQPTRAPTRSRLAACQNRPISWHRKPQRRAPAFWL